MLPKKLACVLAKHRARRREWALVEAIGDGGGVDEDDAAPAAGDADEAFAKAVVDTADAMNAAGARPASDRRTYQQTAWIRRRDALERAPCHTLARRRFQGC